MPLRTLALIPARSGSKGIPGKNTRIFRGKPLFQWAVDIGRETCGETWVSTDNPELVRGHDGMGTIIRPTELATDETPMLAVVRHAVEAMCPHQLDTVVLLQPTQPFRRPEHIHAALKMLEETGADSVVSVVEIPAHYSPEYALGIDEGQLWPTHPDIYCLDDARRRQDAEKAYSRDGTVYAIRRETIEAGSLYGKDCRALIIPRNESVNLDTEEDWALAESMA